MCHSRGSWATIFIQSKLWDSKSKTLYHRWRDGERDNVQLLEGYAFLLSGVVEWYEATLDPKSLDFAIALAETMLAGWLLAQAKISSPEGEMTVVPASPKDRITLNADGSVSGRVRGVPFAKAAKHFAVLASGAGGVSTIRDIRYENHVVQIDSREPIIPLTPASGFGAVTFDEGNIVDWLRRGVVPERPKALDERLPFESLRTSSTRDRPPRVSFQRPPSSGSSVTSTSSPLSSTEKR